MRKIFGCFSLLLCLTWSLSGQLVFDFSSNSQVTQGGTVDIDVSVSNFDEIVSLQVFMFWDPDVMSFNSLSGFTTDLPEFASSNISTPEDTAGGEEGIIRLSWFQSSLAPVSIDDNTQLFTLTLNVIGDQCDMTSLEVGDNPFNQFSFIEVINSNFQEIGAEAVPLDFTVPGTDCGSGGGNEDDLQITVSDVTGEPGSTICVPIIVENFNDILSAQFGLTWDPSVLEFSNTQNFGIPSINESSFNAMEGNLLFLWFDNTLNSVTLPDGSTLFEVCFNIIGSDGSSSTIGFSTDFDLEIVDVNEDVIDAGTSSGSVSVQGDGGNGGDDSIGFIIADTEGEQNTTVCVPVTTNGFIDVQSLQGGIQWDPNILEFDRVETTGNLPGLNENLFNTNNADQGTLTYLWFDNTGTSPVTLDDGTSVFELCFNVIGAPGTSATINFIDQPDIEFADSNGDVILPLGMQGGTFTVTDQGPVLPFGFTTSPVTGNEGDVVCVDFRALNFSDIASIQISAVWQGDLDFVRVDNLNQDEGFFEGLFNQTANNELTLSWFSTSGAGVDIPDGTVLFSLCYELGQCETSGTIDIVDGSQVAIEIGNGDAEMVPFMFDQTTISIGTCDVDPPVLPFGLSTSPVTGNEGDVVCVDFRALNFVDIASIQLSAVWQGDLIFDSVANLNEGQGFFEGLFNETANNEITLSWFSTSGEGITIPDGTVLFSLCYELGACGTTGSIDIVDGSQVSIEIGNGDAEMVPFMFSPTNVSIGACVGPPLGVSATISNVTCFNQNNGSIILDVSGGDGIYRCEWRFGGAFGQVIGNTECSLTNQTPGTYYVIIQDNSGAILIEEYIITQPTQILDNRIVTDAGCNAGGQISLQASGGAGGYSFEWSNGETGSTISNLAPGPYSVTITDSTSCTISYAYQVADNTTGFSLNPIVLDASTCEGGSIDLTQISGGTPPFIYEWDSGLTGICCHENLSPGPYNATITDAEGCSVEVSRMINDLTPSVNIIQTGTTQPCPGLSNGSYSFDITGGCTPFTCNVTAPDGSNLSCDQLGALPAGIYLLNITDSFGKEFNGSFTLVETPITLNIDSVIDEGGADGGSINVTSAGGIAPLTYSWSNGVEVVGMEEDLINVPQGTYTLTITDANGCNITSEPISVAGEGMINIVGLEITSDFNGFDTSCDDICDGSINAAISSNAALPLTIELTHDDGTMITSEVFPIVDLCAGNYSIQVTDNFGVTATEMVTLIGPDPIIIQLSSLQCAEEDDGSISLNVSGGAGGLIFEWDPNVGDAVEIENLSEGGYQFSATDQNNCSADALFTVENCDDEGPPVQGIPCYDGSPFLTPNADNSNDFLRIECAEDVTNNLAVYDRWGRLVHQSSNYQNDWGGLDLDGVLLTEGVYFWVLDAELDSGVNRIFKGYVTLLRDE